MRQDGLQCGNEARASSTQFVSMHDRELLEQSSAASSKSEVDAPGIASAARAANPTVRRKAKTELDGRVVADLETLGERTDRGFQFRRRAGDREERLVLLRLDSGRARRAFAEIQETANFVAEIRERLVVNL